MLISWDKHGNVTLRIGGIPQKQGLFWACLPEGQHYQTGKRSSAQKSSNNMEIKWNTTIWDSQKMLTLQRGSRDVFICTFSVRCLHQDSQLKTAQPVVAQNVHLTAAKRLTWETAVDPRHFKGAHLSQSRFQQSTIYAHSWLNNAVLMVNTLKERRQSQSFRLFIPYLSSCIEFWAKEEKNLALYPSDGALAQDCWAPWLFHGPVSWCHSSAKKN